MTHLYVEFALLAVIAILAVGYVWLLDQGQQYQPTRRQRRAWKRERLPFARALNTRISPTTSQRKP